MNSFPIPRSVTIQDVVETFLSRYSEDTLRAYRADLQRFASFMSEANAVSALERLMGESPGMANLIVERYKSLLMDSNLSPNTINRRLASVRSVIKLGRKLGKINWTLEVANVPVEIIRVVSGPTVAEIKRLMGCADRSRDRAIMSLFWPCLLRRSEIAGIEMNDLRDLGKNTVWIQRKGRRQKEPLGIPSQVTELIWLYVKERGDHSGSLFKITDQQIYNIVKSLCKKAGIDPKRISPHKFRHSGATQLVEMNANVKQIQEAMGHKNLATTSKYVDNLSDKGAEARDILAGL